MNTTCQHQGVNSSFIYVFKYMHVCLRMPRLDICLIMSMTQWLMTHPLRFAGFNSELRGLTQLALFGPKCLGKQEFGQYT